MDNSSVATGAKVRSALVQVLRQCNYRCRHCSQAAPHVGEAPIDPVPLTVLKATVDGLRAAGMERVRFTGGEPLLHPQFTELVSYAANRGIDTSVVTNGSLLRATAAGLADAGLCAAWISLYGASEGGYEAVAQRKPPVEHLGEAIQMLSGAGVKVGIYCSIDLSLAEPDLSLLTSLAIRGVASVKFMQLMEQGRQLEAGEGPLHPGALNALRSFRSSHSHIEVRVSMRSGQRQAFKLSGFSVPGFLGCTAGMADNWSIGAGGGISPCCLMMSDSEPAVVSPPRRTREEVLHRLAGASWQLAKPVVAGSCPALPRYRSRADEEFICPLAYAAL